MLFTHSKVFEEHIAPLVLDIGQHHEHAEDHAGDDGDHHHQHDHDHTSQVWCQEERRRSKNGREILLVTHVTTGW